MLRPLYTVLSGTVLAQLIGVLALPLLTRLFAPEAFGHYQVYQSILNTLVVVAALRLELLLLRVPQDEVARTVQVAVLTTLMLTVVVTGLATLSMLTAWPPALAEVPFPLLLIPLGLLVAGVTQSYSYLLTREHRFPQIVRLKLIQTCAYAATAIAIGLARPTLDGIIMADICGRLSSFAYVYVQSRRDAIALFGFRHWGEAFRYGWANRQVSLLSTPGAFLNSAGAAITPIMMYGHFSPAVSGQYGLVERAASLPLAMIVMSVSQVYVGQLSKFLREHDRAAIGYVNRVSLGTAALAAGGGLALIFFLPALFALVFGTEWRAAGQFGQILLPAYCIQLVAGSLNQSLVAMGCYKYQLMWDAAWPTLIGGAWVLTVTLGLSPKWAVGLHGLAVGLLGLGFILLVHHLIRRYFADPSSPQTPLNDLLVEPEIAGELLNQRSPA